MRRIASSWRDRTRALVVGSALGLAGLAPSCVDLAQSARRVDLVGRPGRLVPIADAADVAARQQAAVDLACPASALVVRNAGDNEGLDYRIAGCGREAVFVEVFFSGIAPRLPQIGENGTVGVYLRRYVMVSDHAQAEVASLRDAAASLQIRPAADIAGPPGIDERVLRRWLDLATVAVHDLACPFASLRLDYVGHDRGASTYLAAGCGVRAQFTRDGSDQLVLTSRVALDASP